MIPAGFDYVRAGSPGEAVALLAEHDRAGREAKLLAGGHSLIPLMKLRLAVPEVLVDVGHLAGLRYVRVEDATVRIGALTRHAELERDPVLAEHAGLLAAAAARVGDRQVRHRGTIGGALAHGDASSDLGVALLALDATVVVTGADGERVVGIDEFFVDFWETAVGPAEMVTEIRVPDRRGARWHYEKFSRRAQDWALVAAAAVRHSGGTRVALGGMATTPVRAREVEAAVAAGAAPAQAAGHAAPEHGVPGDRQASPAYRRHLAGVLTERALVAVAAAG